MRQLSSSLTTEGKEALSVGLFRSFYLAVSGAALAAGYLATAYALRPQPFFLGVAFALCGLLLLLALLRESQAYAALEAAQTQGARPGGESAQAPCIM